MPRRLIIYLTSFITLLLLLLGVTFTLNHQVEKKKQANNILDEIERARLSPFNYSAAPFANEKSYANAELSDGRVANLKIFLRKHNSPLYDFAESIVAVSDKNKFDYRLLPAIAMQESNLCKKIPEDSYNCWGWGIYGDQVIRFSSYDEAIEIVGQGIKKEYLDKGLITASSIMQKYTPSSPNGSWARGVNHFLQVLE